MVKFETAMKLPAFSLYNIDKYMCMLGIVFSLYLIEFKSKYSLGDFTFILLAVLMLISFSSWLYLRKSDHFEFNKPSSTFGGFALIIFYFMLLIASIICLSIRADFYVRPFSYYILISLMVGIVFLGTIFCKEMYAPILLVQTIILGLNLAWSELLLYPTLIGIDPWYHQLFTSNIIFKNIIPVGEGYSMLPIFHLLIANTSILSGLDYKSAAMCSVSLIQIICNVIVTYLLVCILNIPARVGILASLILVISNQHIFMTIWSIPNALASVFILFNLYFYIKYKKKEQLSSLLLLLFFMFVLILTHTIAALAFAVILITFTFSLIIHDFFIKNNNSNLKTSKSLMLIVLFIVSMFSWWNYASGSIYPFAKLISWGFSMDMFANSPTDVLNYASEVPLFESVFNQIGLFIFFSFSLIGLFYMISNKRCKFSFGLAISYLTILSLGFFPFLAGLSLIEHRWWFISQMLLSIPLAIFVYILYNFIDNKILSPLITAIFVTMLSLTLIMSTAANIDNPKFTPNIQMRYALIESELCAVSTIASFSDEFMSADNFYASRLFYITHKTINYLDDNIYYNSWNNMRNGIILIRREISIKPFWLYSHIYKIKYNIYSSLSDSWINNIYNNGNVNGYKV